MFYFFGVGVSIVDSILYYENCKNPLAIYLEEGKGESGSCRFSLTI